MPTARLLLALLCCLMGLLSPLRAQNTEPTKTDDIGTLPALPQNEQGAAIADEVRVGEVAYKGRRIPHILMQPVYKYPPLELATDRDREQYNRLVSNVKKLLPIAKMARITMIETYEVLETLPTKEARKAHINAVERELKQEYTPILRQMTRSQGRLLVKLIDRECGSSGYHIATAFVGSFKANLYQGLAFFIGLNLNKKYDPEGDDRFTERVVRLVEAGQI